MGRRPENAVEDNLEPSPYEIKIAKSASKHLAKMPAWLRESLREAIDELCDPTVGDVVPLGGYDGAYRKRKGDYRILFTVDKQSRTVYVEDVLPRGDAYK